ncbi:MAG: type II secretion system F family protein [bacterium]|nr:type II secretion system F family protein [bacterium]
MIILGIVLFITIMLFLMMIFLAARTILDPEAKRIRNELKGTSAVSSQTTPIVIRRRQQRSDIPWLNRILSRLSTSVIHRLDQLLMQSNTDQPLGVFILLSLVLALTGFLVFSWMSRSWIVALPVGVLAGMAPFFYLSHKRDRRLRKFEEQLPDALDLIARALRAGQAFTSGLQMVAQEFDDPIGSEFEKILAQLNLGVGFQEALRGLADRVSCSDVKFFAISVILQRQSGGNLAEILENISRLIRERFKLRGHIRSLSAEGKISAIILIALPFCLFTFMSVINPEYAKILLENDLGRMLCMGALIMMGIGIVVMKKMITIKV